MHRHFIAAACALLCLLAALGLRAAADAAEIAYIESPDQSVAVTVTRAESGELGFSVTKDQKRILSDGAVGIVTTDASFTSGNALSSVTRRTIDETVGMTSGSYAEIVNRANEVTLEFENGYTLVFRVCDDGVAFRQILSGNGSVRITRDASAFSIPAASNVWAMKTDNTKNTYSTPYSASRAADLDGMYYFPMLYHTPDDVWCLLTEADLYGSGFAGSVLQSEGGNRFSLVYAAYQNGGAVASALPAYTPWRTVVCGDLSTIVENTMVDALTPLADGDYSYVQTGVAAWSWLHDGTPRQDDPALIKRYIDLAAEMRWEYCILDEGWQPHAESYTYDSRTYTGFPDWLPEVVDYASARGVKLFAWLNRRTVDTAAEVGFLEQIAAAGFAGVKVDFFDSESSTIIGYYNRILSKCAELGLLVDLHGTNKPTGERMTYPNIIAKEAVHGDESKETHAAYTTLLPFTRGSLGSTDFTPVVTPFSKSDTTVAHQAALAVLLECGLVSMASSPEAYYASPFYWYYYDLPTHWDDLHYLSGYPGDYVALARRSGEAWYLAAVTTNARTLTLATDFLSDGIYCAAIYKDGASGGSAEYRTIEKGEPLTLLLTQNGGAAVKLVPAADAPKTLAFAEPLLLLGAGEMQKAPLLLPQTAFPDVIFTSSDESVVTVQNGHIFARASGRARITARSAANEGVSATLEVHVFGGSKRAAGWTVKNEADYFGDRALTDNLNPYQLTLKTGVGYVGKTESAEPQNLWMTDAPAGDFEITVKVTGALTHSYNSCLIGIYADGANVIQMSRRFHGSLGAKVDSPPSKLGTVGNIFDFYMYTTKYVERYAADTNGEGAAWMRLTRTGDVYHGYYSYDGVTFTEMPGTLTNEKVANASAPNLLLACQAGDSDTFTNEVVFEDLTVNGEKIRFVSENALLPGDVRLGDALHALRTVLKDGKYLSAADTNRDGKVDLTDVLRLFKQITD
ncbi:MAG: glycoside hydrolase family 97 catalytic domain-containing protein [Clostridia bacterium]|nr:glycoside hydrolase family 97 catalytic domain-containing protein [Clostridia bacterium]